jgi:peroxiredoxin
VAPQLNVGDLFPQYEIQTVQGKTPHIPEDFSGEHSVLLFYRGGW